MASYFGVFWFLVVLVLNLVDGRKHSPLINDENSQGRNRPAECTFGKQIKEIGSSWFADLGPPFGVMYCIKCECIKVQKKRRIVARVQCRNIKNECPKLTCDNPVLLPGSCCKSCPGDFNTPVPSDNPAAVPEESMKHYASLLTGRSSLSVQREDKLPVPVFVNKNNVISTGRFTFQHKNLYYSFYVSDKAARPRFLQFVDDVGNILDEHTLSGPGVVTSLYQNMTRKICGVWTRLPKDYRSLPVQREDKLPVPVFLNKNNVISTGRFTFQHKNLYYSFYVSDKAARPRFLQFVDDVGNILDEHTLSGPGVVTSLYQNMTRKICGVWTRLPKDYRSLSVQREDKLPVPVFLNKNNVISTGRFTFQHKNLYYSFYVSDKAARPRFLQFVDDVGNILDEHTLSGPGVVTSLYQNMTRKICGVWTRLPKDYRRLLKDQKLFAVLVWGLKDQPEFTLSGQITRYSALGTELFSSLLEPGTGTDAGLMAGAGGTAIVSTSSASTPSIHIAVVFNGIFSPQEVKDVRVNITLALEEKQQIIINEVKTIEKPLHELNMIEVSSPVSPAEMRLLTRGRLVLSISSVSRPEALKLSGAVITRATCELFQTPLTSTNSEKDYSLSHPSGLAWTFMNSDGALVYHIQVDQINHPVSLISLVDVSVKRKTELADLTADYKDGWANGTLDRLGPRFLEPLYSGNLAVNIALENQNIITGRLIAKPVSEARDASSPVLLTRSSNTLPSSVVGLGWFSVDNNCHIHYDLTLTGMGGYKKMLQLYLIEMPMLAPGAPTTTRLLEEFKGNQVENTGNEVHELTDEDASNLNAGVAYLEIREKGSSNVLLKGIIRQVLIPAICLPFPPDNTLSNSMEGGTYPAASQPPPSKTCYHEGRFYEENSDWSTTEDPCRVCFCQNGQVRCQVATCPVQTCPGGGKPKPGPGECCGGCGEVVATRGCHLGKYFHSAGSKWHPFLIPNGFDRCIECHCNPDTLSVACKKLQCEVAAHDSNLQSDGVPQIALPTTTTPNPNDILSAGGCKHGPQVIENGKEYHPKLSSIGEFKCVTCKCKDGIVNCERLNCTKSCNNTTYRQRRNSLDNVKKCCSCKRLRRHQHHRNHGQ